MATLLLTLLMSCQSVSTCHVPDLVFPEFPPIELAESGIVVSENWLIRLAEFRIRLEELESSYNALAERYGGFNKK